MQCFHRSILTNRCHKTVQSGTEINCHRLLSVLLSSCTAVVVVVVMVWRRGRNEGCAIITLCRKDGDAAPQRLSRLSIEKENERRQVPRSTLTPDPFERYFSSALLRDFFGALLEQKHFTAPKTSITPTNTPANTPAPQAERARSCIRRRRRRRRQ